MGNNRVNIPDDCNITLPIVSLEVLYGLGEDGTPIIYYRWADGDGKDTVDQLTKAGLVAFVQQGLTVEMVEQIADKDGDF